MSLPGPESALSREYQMDDVFVRLESGEKVPLCEKCGGLMKPDVIQFGQQLPEIEVNEAQRRATGCDLLIPCGSSLVVYPAAHGERTRGKARYHQPHAYFP